MWICSDPSPPLPLFLASGILEQLGKIGGSHLVPQILFYTVEPMGEHELGMVTIDSEIDQVSIFEGIDDKSLCRIFIL